MKKIFIALMFVLGIFGLASCDNGGEGPKTKKTVIQYCGWDLGTEDEPTLKRKMIEAYNAESETVMIEMISPQGDYDTFLTTLASGGALPDIFLVNSVPTAVYRELALNITDLTAADPEWQNVETSLANAITYNNKVYALPAAQNYLGFFANYDLIDNYAYLDDDAENIFAPGEFDYEVFFKTIKEVKDIKEKTAVIGVNATGDMINWLPSVLDETGTITHFVWNGSKFDFRSPVMLDALTQIQNIGNVADHYTLNSFVKAETDEEDPKVTYFGTSDENTVFTNNQMAFLQGATYYSFKETPDFNYKFIGYPNARVVSAGDFLCISKATKNAQLAYDIAKYFSFGAEGINTRYEILDANSDISLTGLPINTDLTVTEKWFDYVTVPGYEEVYQKVVDGDIQVIVEGLKPTPGYQSARYTYNTGITIEGIRDNATLSIGDFIWDVCEGKISVGEYSQHLTEARAALINKEVDDALAKINALVD